MIMDKMNKAKMSLSNEKQRLIDIGPSKAGELFEYTKNCVEPGIKYARKRFVDVGIETQEENHMK